MSLARVLAQLSTGGGLPKRFRPFANQAANEAYLRFSPEWDALNAMREQSAQTMRQQVGQANSAAQLISALANQSQQTLNSSQSPLVQRLAAYDNAPANSSAAVVAQNLGLTHDAASSMLAQAASNAPLRAQQQGLQALTAHQQDLGKINAQRASLAGQVGAFTQGRLGDLVQTDRKDRAAISKQRRDIETRLATSGLDPTTGLYDPKRNPPPKPPKGPSSIAKPPSGFTGSPADWNAMSIPERNAWAKSHGALPGGAKPATSVQMTNAKNKINYALNVAKTHKTQGDARSLAADILVNGQPTFKDPQSGQPIPGIKAVDPLWASIGLDLAYDGHVSNKNAAELHRLGYSVKGLGLPGGSRRPPRIGVGLGASVQLPRS